MANLAKKVIAANGAADQIRVICKRSDELIVAESTSGMPPLLHTFQ